MWDRGSQGEGRPGAPEWGDDGLSWDKAPWPELRREKGAIREIGKLWLEVRTRPCKESLRSVPPPRPGESTAGAPALAQWHADSWIRAQCQCDREQCP